MSTKEKLKDVFSCTQTRYPSFRPWLSPRELLPAPHRIHLTSRSTRVSLCAHAATDASDIHRCQTLDKNTLMQAFKGFVVHGLSFDLGHPDMHFIRHHRDASPYCKRSWELYLQLSFLAPVYQKGAGNV